MNEVVSSLQELLSLASLAKCEVRYDPKTYSDKVFIVDLKRLRFYVTHSSLLQYQSVFQSSVGSPCHHCLGYIIMTIVDLLHCAKTKLFLTF